MHYQMYKVRLWWTKCYISRQDIEIEPVYKVEVASICDDATEQEQA